MRNAGGFLRHFFAFCSPQLIRIANPNEHQTTSEYPSGISLFLRNKSHSPFRHSCNRQRRIHPRIGRDGRAIAYVHIFVTEHLVPLVDNTGFRRIANDSAAQNVCCRWNPEKGLGGHHKRFPFNNSCGSFGKFFGSRDERCRRFSGGNGGIQVEPSPFKAQGAVEVLHKQQNN